MCLTSRRTGGTRDPMSKVGRNDPCPCGSGKKYKHCHWQTEQTAPSDSDRAMRLHELDRELVDRLLRFAAREYGRQWLRELMDQVDLELDEQSAQLLIPCAVYDWASEDGTLLELFLESAPRGLSDRERGWLEAQRRSWLTVWEVQTVTPGLGLSVRDLLTGEERHVLEQAGSRTLSPRDGILGRVVDFEEISVFCGTHPRMLPPRPAAVVVEAIRKGAGLGSKSVSVTRLRAEVPVVGWISTWDHVAEHHAQSLTKLPKLQNTDGDPLLMTKDRFAFDPGERQRIEARLAELAQPGDDGDAGAAEHVFVFDSPGNAMHKSWDNTIVGRAVVREGELVLETNSIRRADDLRSKVEGALDGLVRHRIRDHEDPEVMVKRMRDERGRDPAAAREKSEPPPPEVLEALREFKRRHLESWLDTAIPALGGMTPREAAGKPRKRRELALLLKEIENSESRAPAHERVDVSMLWGELGLREGGR